MTDYADLVKRLLAYFTDTGILVGLEAADAIEALVKERGANRSAANKSYKQGLGDGRDEMRERAEKAEAANLALDRRFHHLAGGPEALDCGKSMVEVMAELAAARAALLAVIDEDGCTCARCLSESEHAPAIAAARADGGE